MTSSTAFRFSAAAAFLGVLLGAFGAHGLQVQLAVADSSKIWVTASFYHLLHAVVLLLLSREYALRKAAWWCFLAGIVLFSGSLYLIASLHLIRLGWVTPLGGLAFLAGWAVLIFGKSGSGGATGL